MADADALRPAGVPGRNPEGPSDAPPPPQLTPPPIVTAGDEQAVMSLVDHLTELRSRIFRSVLAVVVFGAVGFWFGDPIIAWLAAPIPIDGPLFFTGIGDPFVIRTKIALVVGAILAMPVILYQLWAFVAPGLTPSEQRTIRPWVPLALAFFALGVGIAYIVLPYAATFLLGFRTADLAPLLTASEYFGFVTTMFLVFGLVMEFPILLFALSRVGIVTSDRLVASRRYAILGITIFAAVATPGGDVVSMAVLGLTMLVLFEATRIVIRRSGR
jgi:sec-independent protein translocase protein TatC